MRPERIEGFLPAIYHGGRSDGPLAGLLGVMEALHAPAEARLDALDASVDPGRADDAFVVMLAGWFGLDRYLDWSGGRPGAGVARYAAGFGQLRLLIAETGRLRRMRGSRGGLEAFLDVATGAPGFTVEERPPDEAGRPRAFHIRVRAPAAATRLAGLVRRIVEAERPAYATYDIAFDQTDAAPDVQGDR